MKKQLTLVTDLATTNLLSAELYSTFEVIHAGCSAHARRPFWKLKDKDQRLCYWMLSAFLVLEQIEDRIDELGALTHYEALRHRALLDLRDELLHLGHGVARAVAR